MANIEPAAGARLQPYWLHCWQISRLPSAGCHCLPTLELLHFKSNLSFGASNFWQLYIVPMRAVLCHTVISNPCSTASDWFNSDTPRHHHPLPCHHARCCHYFSAGCTRHLRGVRQSWARGSKASAACIIGYKCICSSTTPPCGCHACCHSLSVMLAERQLLLYMA